MEKWRIERQREAESRSLKYLWQPGGNYVLKQQKCQKGHRRYHEVLSVADLGQFSIPVNIMAAN